MDEGDMPDRIQRQLQNMLCAVAESLAVAAKSELEIEAKLLDNAEIL
ncbi:MAG: hypothetical protein HC888_07910 [Candidatus Competibacteraceae bacterium]|nr:hypothetical protein [Candidatus Competibacteraceae bacterium]